MEKEDRPKGMLARRNLYVLSSLLDVLQLFLEFIDRGGDSKHMQGRG